MFSSLIFNFRTYQNNVFKENIKTNKTEWKSDYLYLNATNWQCVEYINENIRTNLFENHIKTYFVTFDNEKRPYSVLLVSQKTFQNAFL